MDAHHPRMLAGTAGPDASFIGRGFSWPLEVDHRGAIRLTDGAEDLDRSIRVVLLTAPGERLMRPQFGCRIWDLLFEPVNANLIGLISEAVRDALAQWEPRVEVLDVLPAQDDDDSGLVRISITYLVKATNDRRNLVYPFYVIPREDS
ncbi:GPW/gp25 family protein [Actinotalea sp. K2]|uniref:GPW/gp25 family protein n=1 Tax=Actinotalea sp. K2 TaxID=2939438 RepID=UPI0020182F65|nr:GPW/gp25 family protein [Actinotalea sp. K2]MCL3861859.1 GPW/gp25 family protein [Actinotalea sp. K2]